jgi:predicted dehydrogenase
MAEAARAEAVQAEAVRVEAVLVGAGNRGRFTYGAYAKARPERLRIVAVAEPDAERRRLAAREHGLPAGCVFEDWRALLAGPKLAPVAIVATGDDLHVAPALAALERGQHVLLEKPIAPTPGECVRVVEAAERRGLILQIGHVLRYTPFYQRVHQILASGELGDLVTVDMREHVAFWHMTHSYVRGKFRSSRSAAPFVLAKTCHDLDLLAWFADRPARRVASFGGLRHFRAGDAPAGAPERCSDGCPVQRDCPHDAVRFYVDPDERIAALWPWSDLSPDPGREARRRALREGPWGRCVYRCDNDVADHQVLSLDFEGGLTASFAVHGFASEERRTIRVSGTRGELRGVLHEGLIETSRHGRFGWERHALPEASPFGHFGGDPGLLDHFTEVVARGDPAAIRASGRSALESHLIGFAAEESRLRGEVVEVAAVRAAAARAATASA